MSNNEHRGGPRPPEVKLGKHWEDWEEAEREVALALDEEDRLIHEMQQIFRNTANRGEAERHVLEVIGPKFDQAQARSKAAMQRAKELLDKVGEIQGYRK